MSAFALRKRLLQKVAEATAVEAEQKETQIDDIKKDSSEAQKESTDQSSPRKSSRATRKRSKKEAAEEAPSKLPATEEAPASEDSKQEPFDRPPKREGATELPGPATKVRRIQRSTAFSEGPNFRHNDDGSIFVRLAEGERLSILGSYGVTVRKGVITIAGAILHRESKTSWVHAPRCHALPVIRCPDEAEIVIESHPEASTLRRLGSLSPLFGRLWTGERSSGGAKETFQIIFTSDDEQERSQDLVSPPEWNKLLAELTSGKNSWNRNRRQTKGQEVFFVCGPKSSGKSTFSRFLTNRLLTHNDGRSKNQTGQTDQQKTTAAVAVLDIDPGQPEYGTPGSLSLVHVGEPNLTVPFCHPHAAYGRNWLVRAHNLAAISPAADPEQYISCVKDLYDVYRREFRHRCPLVINTPGWVQGTGLDILVELMRQTQPTRTIYMSHDGPEETVQGLRGACGSDVPFEMLPSQPGDIGSASARTAIQLRAMQAMSYFHLNLGPSMANRPQLSWDPTPLTTLRPWIIPYAGRERGILGILSYEYQPPPELLADAINGTIVSVVAIERAAAFDGLKGAGVGNADDSEEDPMAMKAEIVRSPEGLPCLPNPLSASLDPQHSRTLGVALIRGIDTKRKELQLLTPLAIDEAIDDGVLRQDGLGVVLVSGKLDVPTWAYTEELYSRRSIAEGTEVGVEEMGDGNEPQDDVDDVDDDDDDEEDTMKEPHDEPTAELPWVEVLQGHEKRAVGSQVWRVRRDLGRGGGE